MLLTGTFKRSLDDKLRIAIPKRFRDAISTENKPPLLYIAPGTDGSLTLYTEESFTRLANQLDSSPQTGKDVRAFSRLFFSRAESVDMDRQGRIRVPGDLAKLATLGSDVMLIGVRDRMEIWNAKQWSDYVSSNARELRRARGASVRGRVSCLTVNSYSALIGIWGKARTQRTTQ